jgi:hypothetical protein
LLFVSSAISMSIPFTVGKLLDYFASPNPVCLFSLSTLRSSILAILANTLWLINSSSIGNFVFYLHCRSLCKYWSHNPYAHVGTKNRC